MEISWSGQIILKQCTAYQQLGGIGNVCDGIMTRFTLLGKLLDSLIWGLDQYMNYHTVTDERDEYIWDQLLTHAGEVFHTTRGLPFAYHQKISRDGQPLGELVIDRKEKTITRNTVLLAYDKAQELMKTEGCVSGPKKLGVFGASYLYPVFLELGICRRK